MTNEEKKRYPFEANRLKLTNLYNGYYYIIKKNVKTLKHRISVSRNISKLNSLGAQCHSSLWLKTYEIISEYVAKYLKHFNVYFINDLPGDSLFALNHYTKTNNKKFEWVFSSYYPKKGGKLLDKWSIITKYNNNCIVGFIKTSKGNEWSNGNLLTRGMPLFLSMYARKNLRDINLCIATGSFGETKEEKKEIEYYHIIISEIETAMRSLNKTGCFILRLFSFFTPHMLSLLVRLSRQFKLFKLVKPSATKPNIIEVYFVGIGFLGIEPIFLDMLEQSKKNLNIFFAYPTEKERDFFIKKLAYFTGIMEDIHISMQIPKVSALKKEDKI